MTDNKTIQRLSKMTRQLERMKQETTAIWKQSKKFSTRANLQRLYHSLDFVMFYARKIIEKEGENN